MGNGPLKGGAGRTQGCHRLLPFPQTHCEVVSSLSLGWGEGHPLGPGPQDPTSWLLPLRGTSGTGAGGVRGCGAPQGARRGADTDVLGQPSRPPGVMSPLRPPCLLPQPGSRQSVVSLSGCTRLTPVLPQPFLTPKEQTSDLGWQNLISASRVCLSYVLILATWARTGDCLTPNSGGHGGWWGDGRSCSLTITQPRSLPGKLDGSEPAVLFLLSAVRQESGGAGSGPAGAGGLWEKFCK